MINKIAVIGMGTMGQGIARFFASKKIAVATYDNNGILAAAAGKRPKDLEASGSYLTRATNLSAAVAEADLILECVPEDLGIKRKLYADIAPWIKESAIVASNTSTIPLATLMLDQPFASRMIIAHFFNPPDLVPLVEIVQHDTTVPGLAMHVASFLRELGKVPVVLKKDIPGFVANRLQAALLREACFLVENGIADAADIDTVVTEGPGIRWALHGPFRIADLGGLDVWQKVAQNLLPVLSRQQTTLAGIDQKVENGQLGLKSGQGFYRYDTGRDFLQDYKKKLAGLLQQIRDGGAAFLLFFLLLSATGHAQQQASKQQSAPAVKPASKRTPALKGTPAYDAVIVDVDAGRSAGVIRRLQGGNLGPISPLRILNLSDYFRECRIPVVRLHDAVWFTAYAVDITTIFRDFNADPSKEQSYDFRQTDEYIDSIVATGADIIYRLGESIEWTKQRYNVNPPPDFSKWADICCHIIRHYNEGWARGFHYNIKYWEIWNEPDNGSATWTGTQRQFFDLYKITARAIRQQYPGVEVGGPAIAIPLVKKDGRYQPSDWTEQFLDFCQSDSVPLDFFSWHTYSGNPWELGHLPSTIRQLLDRHHLQRTKSFLDEWNYIPPGFSWAQGETRERSFADQSSVRGGAFLADVLMLFQDEPIDIATYYTTTAGMYGLFSDFGVPHKSAYAFKAFSALVNKTPVRLEANYTKGDSLVICAGTNIERSRIAVLVSNFTGRSKKVSFRLDSVPLTGPLKCALYAVDDTHNFSPVKKFSLQGKKTLHFSAEIKGPSVVLLAISPVSPANGENKKPD